MGIVICRMVEAMEKHGHDNDDPSFSHGRQLADESLVGIKNVSRSTIPIFSVPKVVCHDELGRDEVRATFYLGTLKGECEILFTDRKHESSALGRTVCSLFCSASLCGSAMGLVFLYTDVCIELEQQQRAATTIQAAYRGWRERMRVYDPNTTIGAGLLMAKFARELRLEPEKM